MSAVVARHIGVSPLDAEQIGIASIGWYDETPLWYYILSEAAVLEKALVLDQLVLALLRVPWLT
jgi:hypothetical protein